MHLIYSVLMYSFNTFCCLTLKLYLKRIAINSLALSASLQCYALYADDYVRGILWHA